jgi:hypothetical protein
LRGPQPLRGTSKLVEGQWRFAHGRWVQDGAEHVQAGVLEGAVFGWLFGLAAHGDSGCCGGEVDHNRLVPSLPFGAQL